MTDRLAKFTPTSRLDRDAILFAAGRRSARGSWMWKAIAGILAASQVVTLIALWPREVPTVDPVAPAIPVAPASAPAMPSPAVPQDMWTVRSLPEAVLEPPPSSNVEFVPAGPPLTAWSSHRFD